MWEYIYSTKPKISSEKCNHRVREIISYSYGNHVLKKNEVGPRKSSPKFREEKSKNIASEMSIHSLGVVYKLGIFSSY